MLSLYRPGTGVLHRLPAGPKVLLLAAAAIGLAALPTAAWTAAVCAVAVFSAYVIPGVGVRTLGREMWGLRLAAEVRDAQRARGVRPSLRAALVPFVVLSLRHADQLGEALAARGVR